MYNLTKNQITEFDSFLSKVPESMVRSHITRIWDMCKNNDRMTTEQAEKIGSFTGQLPTELQTYWNSFLHLLKNEALTQAVEEVNPGENKAQANLLDNVSDLHDGIKSQGKDVSDKSVAPTEDKLNIAAEKVLKNRKDGIDIVESEKDIKGLGSKEDTRSEKEKGVRKGATLEGTKEGIDKRAEKNKAILDSKKVPAKAPAKKK